MKNILHEILELAVYAPSGDNLQPWAFRLGENSIDIFNTSDGLALYDFDKHPSYIAHGALIENIVQIAEAKGYKTDVKLFPQSTASDHIATLTLSQSGFVNPPKLPPIKDRHTDRTPFLTKPIERSVIEDLKKSVANYKVNFGLVTSKKTLHKLTDLLATGDELILDNPEIHSYFYKNVRWSDEELNKTGDGMHIRSISPSFFDVISLKILQNWSLTNILNKIGLAHVILFKRRKIYKQSSALGYFVIGEETPEVYIETGRALQALWLKATAHGLSVQPLSSILFLYNRLQKNHKERISEREIVLIEKVSREVYSTLSVKDGLITFCIRLGYTKNINTIQSVRKSPQII